ncbi:MAG: arginine N-succinyltransferase [Legionellales bacterium]|jgi:arginine N-succinyltransferase
MNAPIKIRPANTDDLNDLLYLTKHIGYGMSHLPHDLNLLKEKINDLLYFFVMEELTTHKVIGCCGIILQNDPPEPFYNYKITRDNLQLVNDYQGLTELGMLALLPEYQQHHYGKFLSRSRFLFLADHQERVGRKIITQIRGQVDEQGHSHFWNAIGKMQTGLSFLEVDQQRFNAKALPKLLALNAMPENARTVMGKPHPHSAPALALLEKEGFKFKYYINIFDGGPNLELSLDENPTINHSKRVHVASIENTIESETYMIATIDKGFCACLGQVLFLDNNQVIITQHTADILNIQLNDTLRISL